MDTKNNAAGVPEGQTIIGKLLDDFSALPVLWVLKEPGALVRHGDVFRLIVDAGKAFSDPATICPYCKVGGGKHDYAFPHPRADYSKRAAAPAPTQQPDLSATALTAMWLQAEERATDTMPAPFQFARMLLGSAPTSQQGQEPSAKHECGACHGSGWVVRDADIGTDQECFVCEGSGQFYDGAVPTAAAGQEPTDAQIIAAFWKQTGRNWQPNLADIHMSERFGYIFDYGDIVKAVRSLLAPAEAKPVAPVAEGVGIKRWPDRLPENATDGEVHDAMQAEIADLRAALASQSGAEVPSKEQSGKAGAMDELRILVSRYAEAVNEGGASSDEVWERIARHVAATPGAAPELTDAQILDMASDYGLLDIQDGGRIQRLDLCEFVRAILATTNKATGATNE